MIGYFNYTMWLTYLSLISASLGILISLAGNGHPFIGVYFLLFSGLCDAFDGKVARTKKDRGVRECKYGVQLDSLSDIVAFGVLPTCIGGALMRNSEVLDIVRGGKFGIIFTCLLFGIMCAYLLSSLIRLAYFNVTEEERQAKEDCVRKYYVGLPVTSAAIIFPTVLLFQYIMQTFFKVDTVPVFFFVMIVMALCFIMKIKVKKPGLAAILVMVGMGMAEGIAFALIKIFLR